MPHLQLDAQSHLHYILFDGDNREPTLVFLHEGLGCEAMWKGFPERLCTLTGCPGLVYDRLGYGKSTPLRGDRTIHYIHEYALRELPTLLDAVIPEVPYVLIGHSDGGSIALISAAERSPLLRGVITEAAHVFVEPETIAGIEAADREWENGGLRGLCKYHGEKTETIFKAWSATWLSNWFRSWNIEYLLPSITAPLLVIQGSGDQYASLRQVDCIASRTSGYARREIIPHCGHVPHLQAQKAVLTTMLDFINRLDTL